MVEEQETCQVKMFRNVPCGRAVVPDGDKCICHSEDPDKDVGLFQIQVSNQLARTDLHDFTRFVFPIDFSFRPPKFRAYADFTEAQFSGEASFKRAQFSEKASFDRTLFSGEATFFEAEFFGEADFKGAKFSQEVRFDWTKFSGEADFTKAQFSEKANFNNAQLSEKASFNCTQFSADASFDRAQFSGKQNFSRAQFSGNARFNHAQFSEEANFNDTQFSGEAAFYRTQFSGQANFHGTQFSGHAKFYGAQFSAKAVFFEAQFSSLAAFGDAKFSGEASFYRARFTESTVFSGAQFSGQASFYRTQFSGRTTFRYLRMAGKAPLAFDRTDLQNCYFVGTDVTKIAFTAVRWPRRRKLFDKNLLFRRAVADELDPEQGQWEEVGNLYRGLQTNYTDHNRYADAGHFYVAEMDINRKTNREWRYLIPSWLYRKVSLYGQSYLRPFLWLTLVLLLFPAIILWGGINPSAASDAASGQPESVSYSFSRNPADCFLFQNLDGDYWTVFFKNISFLTFSREKLSAILVSPLQDALAGLQIPVIVTLVAFFLLALRRQFKRKSF